MMAVRTILVTDFLGSAMLRYFVSTMRGGSQRGPNQPLHCPAPHLSDPELSTLLLCAPLASRLLTDRRCFVWKLLEDG